MAIALNDLTAGEEEGSAGTTSTTASISPTANALVLCSVADYESGSTGNTGEISISGGGMDDWVIIENTQGEEDQRLTTFGAQQASPGSGVITITGDAGTDNRRWTVVEFTGTIVRGPSSAVSKTQVQTDPASTTIATTFPATAYQSSGNRHYMVNANEESISGTHSYASFTEINEQGNTADALSDAWLDSTYDRTETVTDGTRGNWISHRFEIQEADYDDLTANGGGVFPTLEDAVKSHSATQTTTLLCKAPPNIAEDDLILIIVANDDSASGNEFTTTPTGWTKLNEAGNSTSDAHVAIFYKVAAGGEGDITITATSADWLAAWYMRFDNVDTTTPIDVTGTEANDSAASSHTIDEVTTTVDNCLAIAMGGFDGGEPGHSTASTGWRTIPGEARANESDLSSVSSGLSMMVYVKEVASAGLTGDCVVAHHDFSGNTESDGFASQMFALRTNNETPGSTISIAAVSAGVSTVTAALGKLLSVAGVVAAASTATAAPSVTKSLSALIAGSSSVSVPVEVQKSVSSQVSAVSTTTAILEASVSLSAASAGVSSVTTLGTLSRALAASPSAASSVAVLAALDWRLASLVAGSSTTTAAATVTTTTVVPVAAVVNGTSTVTAGASVDLSFASLSEGGSTVSALATVSISLLAVVQAASVATVICSATRGVAAAVTGTSTAAGDCRVTSQIAAVTAATSTVTVAVSVTKSIAALTAGTSTTLGDERVDYLVASAVNAVSSTIAALTITAPPATSIAAVVAGTSTVTVEGTSSLTLVAVIAGTSSSTALLSRLRGITALIEGASTTTADVSPTRGIASLAAGAASVTAVMLTGVYQTRKIRSGTDSETSNSPVGSRPRSGPSGTTSSAPAQARARGTAAGATTSDPED